MAPLKGKFAKELRRMKYIRKKKKIFLDDVKETTLVTIIPIYKDGASSNALKVPSKRDTQDAYWEACASHAP